MSDFFTAPPLEQPAAPTGGNDLLTAPPLESPTMTHSLLDAVIFGLQDSATGLAIRGQLPLKEMNPNASLLQQTAAGVAEGAADIPLSIGGFLAGAVAGSELPGVGTAALGAAGAFAVPMGLRDALVTAYKQPGGPRTWGQVMDIAGSALKGFTKGGILGGATGGAAFYAKGALEAATPAIEGVVGKVGAKAVKFAGEVGAEVGTLGTGSALLDARLPGAQDYEGALLMKVGEHGKAFLPSWANFEDAAVAVGGLHAARDVSHRLMNIFAKTGITPDQVAMDAERNPAIKQQLATSDDLPDAYKPAAEQEMVKESLTDPTLLDRSRAIEMAQQPFAEVPQGKGEPGYPAHINYAHANSEDDLLAIRARLTQLYMDDIQKQRRGTVSWEQTDTEARQLLAQTVGVTPEKLPFAHTPGSPVSTAQLRALTQMARAAAEDLKKKGIAVADAGDNASVQQVTDYLASVERAASLHAQSLGASAEAGRMLNELKNTNRLNVDFDELHKVMKKYGGRKGVINSARAVAEAESPAAALDAASTMRKPTKIEGTLEVWKASILSGLSTTGANVQGNITGTASNIADRTVAAGIGALHGGEKVRITEPLDFVKGMAHGSIDALKMGANAFIGRSRTQILTRAAEKEALAAGLSRGTPEFAKHVDERLVQPTEAMLNAARAAQESKYDYKGVIGAAPDSSAFAKVAGYVIRTPFRFMKAQDVMFRQLNESGEAFALAGRRAAAEGYTRGTREYDAHVEGMVRNPDEEMEAAMQDAGDRAVFSQQLGPRMQQFENSIRGTAWEFVIPFRRIVVNLERWAAERTPGVALLLPSVRADLAAGGAKRDMALARMVIGATVVSATIAAQQSGILTGGGLTDKEHSATRRAAGWQPYSLKINGKYHNWSRLDPIARIMAPVTDFGEIYQAIQNEPDSEGKADKLAKVVTMSVLAIGNALVNQTYMQSVSETLNALTDPDRYAGRWLQGYARSLVPNIVGQTARQMDPERRQINSLLEAIEGQIPGLREHLLPIRNPLTGQPEPSNRSEIPFGPVSTSTASTDKVVTEANRLKIHLAGAPRSVHIVRGSGKAGDIKLTPEQRGAFTQAEGESFHRIMDGIVNTPGWDDYPDAVKSEIYQHVMNAARAQGRMAALPPIERAKQAQTVEQIIESQFQK